MAEEMAGARHMAAPEAAGPMKIAAIAFTERGEELAKQTLTALEDCATSYSRGWGDERVPLGAWAQQAFRKADALLFVGAAGIAVRAIAPYVQSKVHDPAVLVMDESGTWVVPLLSGHIGGANRLARRIAGLVGARAVLTTATDARGVWAVDDWAAARGMAVSNPGRVKMVSGALLKGRSVVLRCGADIELLKPLPNHVEVITGPGYVDVAIAWESRVPAGALHLVPRCLVVGLGARRGAPAEDVEAAIKAVLEEAGADERALAGLASIDVKADEAGFCEVAAAHGLPFTTYSAEQLKGIEGSVSSSSFVAETVGVDNVCERAALAGGGRLLVPKTVRGQVTAALAVRPQRLDFADDFEGASDASRGADGAAASGAAAAAATDSGEDAR